MRPGGIECDADGLRVGGVALLVRDGKDARTKRDEDDLDGELSKLYGFPLDLGRLRGRIEAVAAALKNGDIVRAQIGALLLQLPDPPALAGAQFGELDKRRLARDLAACGLLKADADWDDKHPRTGAPPNASWFAPKSGEPAADEPKTGASSSAGAPSRIGAETAFVAPAPAASASMLLAEDLSPAALDALATLAARFSVATILFGAIFIPSESRAVEEGRLPGRPDVSYRWDHAEGQAAVTLRVLVNGAWRTLAVGGAAPNGLVFDREGWAVARIVGGPGARPALVAATDALDRAIAELRRKERDPAAAPADDDNEPRLCPRPEEEPATTKSANAIAYQEYVTGLKYPLAILIGDVWFDGCDRPTGILLDAKGKNDHIFDLVAPNALMSWVYPDSNPAIQMKRQSDVAVATGRQVVWRVQTEKTYLGLKKIADDNHFPNLSVVYDPN